MQVRSWRVDDLPQVNCLLVELAKSLGSPYHGSLDLLEKHFRLSEGHREMYENYVYTEDDRLVGFASMVFYSSALHRHGTALINELVVADGYRGKGIGRMLLEYCLVQARGKNVDEIEVGVEPGNKTAIAFYKAERVGRRISTSWEGSDRIKRSVNPTR